MLSPEQILEGLDPEQREVATTLGKPLCVLAGAGTGKTRAMTHRIAYAVATGAYRQSNVLAVTFTQKAAAEMRSRLRDLGAEQVQARTFHSAALRQLTYFWRHTVGGPTPELVSNKIGLVANAASQLHLSVDRAALRDIASEIEWAKVSMILPEQYPVAAAKLGRQGVSGFEPRTIARVMSRYEVVKSDAGVIDFDDVLLLTASMIEDYPQMAQAVRQQYKHFVVDEFQDVSPLQYRLLRAWLGNSSDVCVVGDAAQTIYTFAGADADYLLKFREHFPRAGVIKLERNYRSTPQIVEAANGVLGRAATSQSRGSDTKLTLRAQRDAGERPVVVGYPDDIAEAREVAATIRRLLDKGTSASDIAILFRTNAQSENFEDALSREAVPFLVRGGEKFFQRIEVRHAMSALRAALNVVDAGHDVSVVVRDVLGSQGWSVKAPEGTGAVRERWDSLNAIVNLADAVSAREGATLARVMAELDERAEAQSAPTVEGVTLASIHAAKGLEWPVVFVVGASEGLIPISMAKADDAVEEERRLFYVALTRARDVLTVTWSAARSEGARGSRHASRFIAGAFERRDEGVGGRATARPSRRRGGMVHVSCKTCSEPLGTPAEQKLGRHRDCGGEQSALLFGELRRWRLAEAQQRSLPAFAVFTDQTLLAIADRAPSTAHELLQVPGVGQSKLERFGDAVIDIVKKHSGK